MAIAVYNASRNHGVKSEFPLKLDRPDIACMHHRTWKPLNELLFSLQFDLNVQF